jgi:hypothetical protein
MAAIEPVAAQPAGRPEQAQPADGMKEAEGSGVSLRRRAQGRSGSPPVKLGRPKVSVDEDLDLLFHDDYQARQVFAFLQVKTVGELEGLRPQEIVDRLIAPTVATVDRIRRRLAEKNRALAGDEAFAVAHLASLQAATAS